MRLFRKLLLGSALLFAVCSLTLSVLWYRGTLQSWLKNKIVASYLKSVQPHLPFKIENVEIKENWREILDGRISDFSATLKWDQWRIRISGPVELGGVKNHWLSAHYSPQITIEPVHSPAKPEERSPPIQLDITVRGTGNLFQLDHLANTLAELRAVIKTDRFKWPLLGIDVDQFQMVASWQDSVARIQLSSKSVSFESNENKIVRVENIALNAEAPLVIQPLKIGPRVDLSWKAKGSEVLWDDLYLDLPLHALPIQARLLLNKNELSDGTFNIKEAVSLKVKFKNPLEIEWKTIHLPIHEILTAFIAAVPTPVGPFSDVLPVIREIDVRRGTLQTAGRAVLSKGFTGSFRLLNTDLKLQRLGVAMRGLNLNVPTISNEGANGAVNIDQLYFRQLKGQLAQTNFSFKKVGKKVGTTFGVDIPALPLQIDHLPIKVGPITGTIKSDDYELTTSLISQSFDVSPLIKSICVSTINIPPMSAVIEFPSIEFSSGTIDPTGAVRVNVLGGTAEVDEIGIYDLLSEVPEFDFNLRINGIRLDKLGEWLSFGEMAGTMNIQAKDVTFQSWLPTHYDFRLDLHPPPGWKKVQFSSDAMKNLIRLLAGEDIDNLPGLFDWIAFRGPQHRLWGYDVYYGGVSVFSADGAILLETHDPADVKATGNHYILNGPWIKMPLKSSHYPLVVDATAMGNFVRQMFLQLGQMRDAKTGKMEMPKETNDETNPSCSLPDFNDFK